MSGARTACSLFFALALGAAQVARAAPAPPGVPGINEGTITLLGGARLIPGGSFFDDQANAGYRPWKTAFEPGALLALGYAPEPDFHITVDFGYARQRLFFAPGTLEVRSFTILLGVDIPFVRRSWVTLYAGGGIGYSLNTLSQTGNSLSSNSSAGYLCLGARFPIAAQFALVIEDRYTLSSAGLPGPTGPLNYAGSAESINVGGNFLSIGLQFHSLDSEDKTRPLHP